MDTSKPDRLARLFGEEPRPKIARVLATIQAGYTADGHLVFATKTNGPLDQAETMQACRAFGLAVIDLITPPGEDNGVTFI